MFVSKTQLKIGVALIIMVSLFGFVFQTISVTEAAPNYQINYQGKLTTAANIAVEDGVYNMRFWLLTSPSIATTSAVWTESLTGTNKVQVTNGLFSIMLGSTSPLTSVDFNQTLYLGVEIGGTTTPGWDGEMSPRKVLGTVPAAFEADKLDGLNSTQFVRTDATSTIATSGADTLLTITQNGAGDIFNVFDGATEVFSILDGGNVGIGTSSPVARFSVAGNSYFGGNVTATGTLTVSGLTTLGNFTATNGTTTNASSTNLFATNGFFTNLKINALRDSANTLGTNGQILQTNGSVATWIATSSLGLSSSFTNSAELAALLSDETGTGLSVFGTNPLLTGFRSSASSTIGDGTAGGGLTVNGGATTTSTINVTGAFNNTVAGTGDTVLISRNGTTIMRTGSFNTEVAFGGRSIANIANVTIGENAYLGFQGPGPSTDTYFYRGGAAGKIQITGTTPMFQLGGITSAFPAIKRNGAGIDFRLADDSGYASSTMLALTVSSSTLSSSFAGNVGIGSTTPSRLLTVQGDGYFLNNITAASSTLGYASSTALTVSGNTVLADFTATNGTTTNASSTNLFATNGFFTNLKINALRDSANSLGTNGQILQTNGSVATWVATSTLGLGGGSSNWVDNGSYLSTLGAGDGIIVSGSSTIGAGTGATGLTISGNSTTTLNAYIAGTLGIGTTTPSATLALTGSGTTNLFAFASSTGSNLLTLDARGVLSFGTTTTSNIFVNGGPTSSPAVGSNSIAIGNEAYANSSTNTPSLFNIAIGYRALYGSSSVPMTGTNNLAMGYTAGRNNTTGGYNMFVGDRAGYTNTTGSYNTFMGYRAGYANTTGSYNFFAGYDSGLANTTGSNNIQIGERSGNFTTTGSHNIFFGKYSGNANTTGYNNIFLGQNTGVYNTTGSSSIAIGFEALRNVAGQSNIAIGDSALRSTINNTYASSTAIGISALRYASTSGNTALGYYAGIGDELIQDQRSVGDNFVTFLGFQSSRDSLVASTSALNNITAIGANAKVGCSNCLALGGLGADAVKVGIGTSSPSALLTVSNNISTAANTPLFTVASTTGGTATSTLFTVLANGNVGIGTNAPGNKLTVKINTIGDGFAVDGATSGGISPQFSLTVDGTQRGAYGLALGSGHYSGLTSGSGDVVMRALGDTGNLIITNQESGNIIFGTGSTVNNDTAKATLLANGNFGIGTTSPSRKLTVQGGDFWLGGNLTSTGTITGVNGYFTNASSTYASTTALSLYGSLFDRTASAGTNGMVLQTNGSGVTWVATSTLGLGGSGSSNWTDNGSYLSTLGAGDGIIVAGSSTIGAGTGATGLTISGNSTTTLNSYIGGTLGIGTTSPSATLALTGSGTTNLFAFASSTGSSLLTLDARGVLQFGTTTNANIFIGGGPTTTDLSSLGQRNVALGQQALSYISTGATDNIALGYQALYGSSSVPMTGDANFAAGYQSLMGNTTGSGNLAIGSYALWRNTTGYSNIAIGNSSLERNVSGNSNVSLGDTALRFNTTGSNNLAFGTYALGANVTGYDNVALGQYAIGGTSGAYNVALGSFALQSVTGNASVGVGYNALGSNNTGATSTALGYRAGYINTTGNNNLYLGDESDSIVGTLSNVTAIGSHAKVGASNSMVLGGSGIWNTNIVTGTSTPWAKFSIQNNYGSTTALLDIATTTSSAYATSSIFRVGHDGRVSIGSTTPESLLFTIQKTGVTGADVAGIKEYLQFTSSVSGTIAYGDNAYIVNAPTATSTLVGKIIRVEDSTSLGNTVRGLEVQAHRGTNTKGENTGISGFGRTFGLRGTTEGDAGDTLVPAGVFAQSRGTTQGNALRAYSGSITTTSLVQLFHDTSAFTGTGLQMNFGNSGGSFSSSTSKFVDFQNSGTSKFSVTAQGTTTIGDGTTNNMAGLQIGYGGICVDNDGACTASTTGRITSVSLGSGNSDLAEMYFSSDALETGEIVALSGGLSIERARRDDGHPMSIIGVVSTKPGLLLGFDDESLTGGETSYPVGLKGRVPVKLSTENGPIKKGDRIALSSIAGVGMKATESSVVVGIALEDYDGARAYTSGYMNQFGDDLVKAKLKPLNQNMDARTQDGCSYGGGAEEGGTPCVKDKVKSVKVETTVVDNRTEVLAELQNEAAKTESTPSGETVEVGQALMFIDLQYYTIASEQSVLAELLSTSTVENAAEGETLWSRIKTLAQNFVDGVLKVAGIKTDELCVGNVCIDESTFLKMVEKSGETSTAGAGNTTVTSTETTPPPAPAPVPEPDVTSDPTVTSTATTTDTTTTTIITATTTDTTTTTDPIVTTDPDSTSIVEEPAPPIEAPIVETPPEPVVTEETPEPEVVPESSIQI